jgi:hypothetical protein
VPSAGASGSAAGRARLRRFSLAGRAVVIYDLRGMRRPPQDRAALCGTNPLLRVAAMALALSAMTVLSLFSSASLAAQAGCAGKPGSPDHAALLQYCPEHEKKAGSGGSGSSALGATPPGTPPGAAAAPAAAAHQKTHHVGSHTDIPLTSYPSSGGINLLLILLIAVALGAAVAYGARRWRRSRPQTS